MNSNGGYTICNLDNNTYSTQYGPPEDLSAANAYGGYGLVNNGDCQGVYGPGLTGQLGPGLDLHTPQPGGASLPYDPGSVLGPPGGGGQGHGDNGYGPLHPGTCASGPPPGMQPTDGGYYYSHPHHHGNMINNGMGGPGDMHGHPGLGGSTPYPAYPDQTGMLCSVPCSTPGYCLPGVKCGQNPSPNSDQGPVTTYKWMTVKRTVQKTCKYIYIYIS